VGDFRNVKIAREILGLTEHFEGESITRVHQKNALQPFIYLAVVLCPSFLLFAWRMPGFVVYGFVAACVAAAVPFSVGICFAIFDRDRLQTEDYNLNIRSLRMLEARGGREFSPEERALTANPPPTLPPTTAPRAPGES
jgi:hypothetical protein